MNQILFSLQQLYNQIPGWVITGLASGFTAVMGLAAKFCWDWLMEKRELRHVRVDKLEKFASMVDESKNLSTMQIKLCETLARSIRERLNIDNFDGNYDGFFSKHYDTFTDTELDTHSMIRAISLNSLNRINAVILTWIAENPEFKNNSILALKKSCGPELAKSLTNLELHLNLWNDKFSVWIADNEKHALVTVGDEDSTGIAIPEKIDDTIDQAIEAISHHNLLRSVKVPF